MEFLRFGSSIPGSYWGCCAVCIIQNFNVDPDTPHAIQIVDGDGGIPVGGFVGKTYKEVFLQRLRFGTFDTRDMPNHGFLAILTDNQINGAIGKKWLAILKAEGFEFIRTVSNSVYDGQSLLSGKPSRTHGDNPNYVFGLFRNVGKGACANPYMPPKAWTILPKVVDEAWELYADKADTSYANEVRKQQTKLFKALPKQTMLTQAQVEAAGITPTMAGKRSKFPQQLLPHRKQAEAQANQQEAAPKAATISPFNSL